MRSDEERRFASWLDELQEYGFVESYLYEPYTFELYDGFNVPYKKKKNPIHNKVRYTPDFEVTFTQKAFDMGLVYTDGQEPGLFYTKPNGCNKVLIEIKGGFRDRTERDTVTKICWTAQLYNEYVQIVRLEQLFEKTFYPHIALITEKFKLRCKNIKGVLTPLIQIVNTINKWITKQS